nr:two-component regulator propeller domain-containing protein [uncultured Carboxylicivirga sp.]
MKFNSTCRFYIYYCLWVLFMNCVVVNNVLSNEFKQSIHQQWHFNHLSVEEGLSNNYVKAINQDKYGYIWIATTFGLNRFNGLTNDCFYHSEADSTTLVSNYISSLFIDSNQTFWVGTDKGLQCFNYEFQNFTIEKIPDGKIKREVFCIAEDQEKLMLVGTSSGLYSKRLGEEGFRKIELKHLGLPNDSIYRMVVDEKNNLWITTYQTGLYYFNREDNTVTAYTHHELDAKSLPDDWIHYLYLDRNNTLWVGTYNTGFCRFNSSDSTFTHFYVNPREEFTKRIRTIFEDNTGKMFLGSRRGLFLFNKESGVSELYALDDHPISKLSQNSVTCSFVDKYQNVWLGTHSGGVTYFNTLQNKFNHIKYVKNDTHFLNTLSVHCFAKKGNKLYVGTEKGINVFDKETQRFTYWQNDASDPLSLSYDDVKDIVVESKDSIWVATNRGGLNLLDSNGQLIKLFKHDKTDPYSLPSNKIYNVYIDSNNILWVISNEDWDRSQSIVSRYDRKTGRFIQYKKPFFMGFAESQSGDLCVGGYYGFFQYDRDSDDFIAINNGVSILRTDALFIDSDKNIWIGSYKGLTKYDYQTKKFIDISKELKLGVKEIYGITGNKNILWVSSNNGLIRLNDIKNLSVKKVSTFIAEDGLQSRDFNYNACYQDSKGYCYFGGDNGFNVFHSDSITSNPYPPEIFLASINVEGQKVVSGTKVYGRVVINKSVYETESIELSYKVRSFTLFFNILHYANAKSNRYKYKFDEDEIWNYADATNNYITFWNLKPGLHHLIVYGINADGKESLSPVKLKVNIYPPFWYSTWFIIVVVVSIALLILIAIYMKERRLLYQKSKLEKVVAIKTKELMLRNMELSKQKEEIEDQKEEIINQRDVIFENNKLLEEYANNLEEKVEERTLELSKSKIKAEESDRLKTSFLKNISHEVRTPLNAIIGFINIIGDDLSNPDNLRFFEVIKSSGYTLIKTIEDVIDYAKIETDTINVFIEKTSVEQILIELFEHYKVELSHNNAEYNQTVDLKIEHLVDDFSKFTFTDRDRLKQILDNLLSNAVKFTHQGEIVFGISYSSSWHIGFYVKDTGIGIHKTDQDKIFDRFRKIEEKTQNLYRGGGLGLAISKYLVELLGGTIEVESVVNEGSTFSFTVKNLH